MAAAATLVLALLCLACAGGIASSDSEPCRTSDLQISTSPTGHVIGGKPECKVTVANQCSCPLSGVVVNCPDGVPSAAAIDSTKIRVVDNKDMLCLVNSGLPINKGSPVTFTYAWDNTVDFTMNNITPRC